MKRKTLISGVAMGAIILVIGLLSRPNKIEDRKNIENTTTTTVSTVETIPETTITTTTTTTTTTKKKTKKKTTTTTTTIEPIIEESIITEPITTDLIETTTTVPPETTSEEIYVVEPSYGDYTPYDLQTMGVISWGGYRYTYYSELVLPGYGLSIEGRHVDEYGFVCDGEGYICVASSSLPWGSIVDTPFGRQGKVYDSGCAWDVIDIYVHW